MTTINERIRNRRKELRISVDEVAEAIGVSRSTVYRYESSDIEKVPTDVLVPLAQLLRTTPAYLLSGEELPPDVVDASLITAVPIVAAVRAGFGSEAREEFEGYRPAYDVRRYGDVRYFRVVGDSMAPDVREGDYVLVRVQPDVENGEMAVVLVNGEEGMLKRVQKRRDSVSLISNNPAYPPRVFVGEEIADITIYGKVLRVERDM